MTATAKTPHSLHGNSCSDFSTKNKNSARSQYLTLWGTKRKISKMSA